MTSEHERLEAARERGVPWRKWGPYLSERQWGTVREDYSPNGDAWDYLSHDQARSRAYRWGEDGLAGISDLNQQLCFSLALWNGADPILKERLFGLSNREGNHGEDVKEYYFYLDSTPTHSYMKYLYKYPQSAFPYDDLVQGNRSRGKHEHEYELIDTGVFDLDRYFDVFVEYAKESPQDILIQISVHNRGALPVALHVLPTLWFRNCWSWSPDATHPQLRRLDGPAAHGTIAAEHPELGDLYLYCARDAPILFTDNITNTQRIFGFPNPSPYVKDGINNYIVHGQQDAVNPDGKGTKAAPYYRLQIGALGQEIIRLRLTEVGPVDGVRTYGPDGPLGARFAEVLHRRCEEADEYYATIVPPSLDTEKARVMRQALAGMLWSKQFYCYDVNRWLEERGSDPFKFDRVAAPRNDHWHHMNSADVISMPDKWEYPWFATWDTAFHVLALSLVDEDFAKEQLDLMLRDQYLHPNGQMPAYEWNFGDVNPPVHAWATIFTYYLELGRKGVGDHDWLQHCFQKLLLNFTWWVNRKDRSGRNVFEGGFLGLDNIGVFDRSAPLPTGGYLEQADGTAWMALFCQNMFEIAEVLAMSEPVYAEMALKFLQHFLWIASAIVHLGGDTGMWDEEDGFFYDVLRMPDGHAERLKVRSIVGLLPLCAATSYAGEVLTKFPDIAQRFHKFLEGRGELVAFVHDFTRPGFGGRFLGAILNQSKLRRVLEKVLDPDEFLSPYGIRSLSRYHAEHPYVVHVEGQEFRVTYSPAESDSNMFGGNSNWRGPIWMPVNGLIIRALLQYYSYYGTDFLVECPTGSGQQMNLYQVAEEIARRLASIFLPDQAGKRPLYGGNRKFQEDPHWRDYILFYEYFHGDNGAGLGASHQTGWSGLVARLLHVFATVTPAQYLEGGKMTYFDAAAKAEDELIASAVAETQIGSR
jgi:hypothetical protein